MSGSKDKYKSCLELIAKESGLGDISSWTNRDFEQLSLLIEEKTRISLSVSTLIRLFRGKLSRIPHKSTLDALAQYLDYQNWHEFLTKGCQEDKIMQEPTELSKNPPWFIMGPRTMKVILPISAVVVILSFFLRYYVVTHKKSQAINPSDYSFVIDPTSESGIPGTVKIRYDIPEDGDDTIAVQFQRIPGELVVLDRAEHFISHTYLYPGFFKIKFFAGSEEIKEVPYLVKTGGWLINFQTESPVAVPYYVPQNDRMLVDGALRATVEMEKQAGLDLLSPHYTSYYFVDELGEIYGDDFQLSLRLKNPMDYGGVICQLSRVNILCKDGIYHTIWNGEGCGQYSSYKIAPNSIDGSMEDLSCLVCNLNEWQTVGMRVKNNIARFYLQEQEVLQKEGVTNFGRVVGLCVTFAGLGAIDNVSLSTSDGIVAIDEDFGE